GDKTMIGKIIGNYKIEQKLGEGGMGAVYKGVDTMLDREVAIKALRPELASQTSIVERFRSEAVTLAKLQHPNIATLYSLFRQGDELYMVLEFVRGETLERVLQRRGALPASEVIPVFSQILDGINHAHEFGIVHRDIKPANMMLTENGKLKVLDFGIARLLGSARMTRAGNIIGTLEYMAPEQVKGLETDARSDIYALGMLLYEMLTGRTPFVSENEFELMKLQTEAMPPAPRQINPSIPEEVEAAIMRAIQKNPDERFQTAGEFREVLLDAGFAAHGSMRRSTGSHKPETARRPSQPPVSQPETDKTAVLDEDSKRNLLSSSPVSEETLSTAVLPTNEIKETRLDGGSAEQSFQPMIPAIKGTRLGDSGGSNSQETSFLNDEPRKSFFDNLTWIHYAGASFVAVMFLGLLVVIPLFIWGGSGGSVKKSEVNTNTNVESSKQNPQIVVVPNQPANVSPSRITEDDSPLNNPQRTSSNSMANSPSMNAKSNSSSMSHTAPSSPTEVAEKPKNEPKQNKTTTKQEPQPRENAPQPRRNERAANPQPRDSAPPKSSDADEKLREKRLTDH
ncbi:MAG: protein kinase domain-containing protein, partial [Pyrinomonadaceae bacterium]